MNKTRQDFELAYAKKMHHIYPGLSFDHFQHLISNNRREDSYSHSAIDDAWTGYQLALEVLKAELKALGQPESPEKTPDGKFHIGQILRYGGGETALFRVDHIEPYGSGSYRLYGTHCLGGNCSADPTYCYAATPQDVAEAQKSQFYCL